MTAYVRRSYCGECIGNARQDKSVGLSQEQPSPEVVCSEDGGCKTRQVKEKANKKKLITASLELATFAIHVTPLTLSLVTCED
jgi:hypothetical protein